MLLVYLVGAGLAQNPCAGTKATDFYQIYREVLRGDFTSGATSLLYTGAGSIVISDIPANMVVDRAGLFWVCEEYWPTGDLNWGYFNGNYITGIQLAYDCDNCWDPVDMSTLYYADVTPYVWGNGTYNLTGFPHPGGFVPEEGANGATLVIIYCDPQGNLPKKTISIYAGAVELIDCGPLSTWWTQTGFTATNPVINAKYAISVANTQSGQENYFVFNNTYTEYMYGIDHPGPAWDHWYGDATSLIPGGAISVEWYVSSSGLDCIEPVLSIISVTSTDALTSDCSSLGNDEQEPMRERGLFLLSSVSGKDRLVRLLSVGAAGTEFLVVNATGSVVKRCVVPQDGEFSLSLSDVNPGVYTLVWEGRGRGRFLVR